MMKVVAPESAVDEGERVIVLSDLSGSDLEFWIGLSTALRQDTSGILQITHT